MILAGKTTHPRPARTRGPAGVAVRQPKPRLNPEAVGTHLYNPAYATGLWRLNHEGLIPEGVTLPTFATTRETTTVLTKIGPIEYRHLPAHAFFGYRKQPNGAAVARPEKALLDFPLAARRRVESKGIRTLAAAGRLETLGLGPPPRLRAKMGRPTFGARRRRAGRLSRMSDRLIRETAEAAEPVHRLNVVKELLQGSILLGLAKDGLLSQLAFHGGTALRLVHRLRRYSEDLDFIRLAPSVDPAPLQASIARTFTKHGLFPQIGHVLQTAANTANKQLLRINIAALTDKKLQGLIFAPQIQITLEIDLHPPDHIVTERRQTKHGVDLDVLTLPSLMSGKLHILLTRRDREKGRDWYDYAWYRQQGITPNLAQLQSAIEQTNGGVNAAQWPAILREIIPTKNWPTLRDDVRPFLERRSDLEDLTEAKLLALTPEAASHEGPV